MKAKKTGFVTFVIQRPKLNGTTELSGIEQRYFNNKKQLKQVVVCKKN